MRSLVPILCLAAAGVAQAQTLKCGNDHARTGDAKATILQKCGEPVMKDSFCKPAEKSGVPTTGGTVVQVGTCETVEEWTYRPGPGQFITMLRFEGGQLRSIKYGDRIR
ncbi:DUF2845 domain-containing protein [Eleftheria terrae]|uniref:DUF2845 domain-containing protein n=1 Tax=Eleftheria terrae TaxID=1597781 RepID=UPI00263B4FA3|nr:DUF2845 domain-containing protein [Eleftheria terrae]WKB55442.1 DUF2845 domain-containing protein [Eleftheria terrae]